MSIVSEICTLCYDEYLKNCSKVKLFWYQPKGKIALFHKYSHKRLHCLRIKITPKKNVAFINPRRDL